MQPVASAAIMAGRNAHAGAVDRHALAAMADDVTMAARVAESAAARLSPHVHAWARHNAIATGGDADEYAPRRSHHSSSGAGASAPLGFASDRAPTLEAHECVSGLCVRPFPPLLVESCIQRYGNASSSSDASERTMGALQLSELFIAQCVQLLHGVRFLGGRDLFDPLFLHDIDDMMRAALWRGEAKGRKAAEEALGRSATAHDDDDGGPAPSPRDFGRSIKSERSATLNPSVSTSTSAASAAAASSSVAHAAVPSYSASERARQRRATQDDSLIHHPFAPAAYEAASSDGAATARLVGSGSGGYAVEGRSGRGLSRRAQGAAAAAASQGQRPRQCLLSSLLGLIRFTNALATRLKYWRGQLKAKQKEIATLTAMAAAAAAAQQHAASTAPPPAADEAAQQAKLDRLSEQVVSLEAQLASAHATLHEYESSGRARERFEPTIGDMDIPFGLQGQLHAARLGLEESRSEAARLAQEKERQESQWEQERAGLVGQLSESRSEAARLREQSLSREEELHAARGDAEERGARVEQLEAMLLAVKQRVSSREAEWEARIREWEDKHRGVSCGPESTGGDADPASTPVAAASSSPTAAAATAALAALREDLAREKAQHAASRASQESEWHASQAARDKQEQSLRAEAARARQAHASLLREYESLRQENTRVQAVVDAEKSELEAKLRRGNTSLAEARNTIAGLKAQLKRAVDQHAVVHPPVPELPSVRLGANSSDEQQQQQQQQQQQRTQRKRDAEAKAAAQEEAEQRLAQEAKQREAQAAAEKIKAAAAARKKAKKAEAQAAAAAAAEAAAAEEAAAAAAAAAPSPEADKPRKKKKQQQQRATEPSSQAPSHPLLAPPTALELSKPTPKLSSGYGRCVYEPGEWYEGWWVNYERSGQGTYQWRDGRRYDGDWLCDKKHGQGRYSWPDGDRFEGAYADDKMHGWGTYVFSDGTRYEGEWARDMSHGRGTFHYADSARFEGNFDRDQKHGPGLMFLPSGECFSEHWVQGKRISSISVKQLQQLQQGQQQQQQQRPVAMRVQSQPPMQPPPAHAKNLSRIRLAAAEQLQMAAAASARGSARR